MFNYDYPSFLPQAIQAIVEHPNAQQSDKDLLNTYCKLFELDWKGEKTQLKTEDLLCHQPLRLDGTNVKSYGTVTSESLNEMIRKACAPYVEETAQKLLNYKI